MSNQPSNNNLDPFAPWRTLGETNLNIWANMMADALRTDIFAHAMNNFLDTYMAASAPFQVTIDQYMKTVLPRLNVPLRDEVTDLARRLGEIEQFVADADSRTRERLDNLPAQLAQLEQQLHAVPQQLSDVGQQLQPLSDRINHLEQQLGALPDRLNHLEQQLGALPDRLNHLEQQLGALPDRLNHLEQQLGALPDRIAAVEQNVQNFSQQLSDIDQRTHDVPDRFATLEQRLGELGASLEQRVHEISSQLAETAGRIEQVDSGQGPLQEQLQGLHDNIGELRQAVDGLRAQQPSAAIGRRRKGAE